MIYVLGIMLAVILSLGGIASCEHKDNVALKAQIEANKKEAKRLLEATIAQGKADSIASQKDYDDALKTLSLSNRQYAGKLRDYGRRVGCPSSGPAPAGVPQDQTAGSELSDEAGKFLRSEADRADLAATYAESCRQYAIKPSIREAIRGKP